MLKAFSARNLNWLANDNILMKHLNYLQGTAEIESQLSKNLPATLLYCLHPCRSWDLNLELEVSSTLILIAVNLTTIVSFTICVKCVYIAYMT